MIISLLPHTDFTTKKNGMIGLLAQVARTQRVGATQDTHIAGTAMTGVRSAPF
jgi:hypothetical protein